MRRSLATFVFLLAAAVPVAAQDRDPASRPAGEYVDAVVAKVNRAVITKSQVDRELGAAAKQLSAADYEKQFRFKLLQLVFASVEQDAVERVGLVVPRRFVLEQIEQMKERKGAAEVLAGIKEQGYKSEEDYQDAFGKDISRQTYLAAQAGQYGLKAPQFRPDFFTEPTASEIRQYYRQHENDEFHQKNQARVSAIFLPYLAFASGPDQPRDRRTLEIAATIRAEIERGTPFATLVTRYGRELKVDEGGDLGYIDATSSYQKDIVDYGLKGPVRKLSDPILYPTKEAPRGIALVYVVERVEERVMPFTEAQSKIRDALRAQRVDAARKKIIEKLLEDAYVSPPDLKRDLLRAYQQ